jgi:hypothetical protein
MKAYPYGIPSVVAKAVSASLSNRATFLNATVPTASIALNILGPQGPAGSSGYYSGLTGPTGPTGAKGPTGLGVYLLSSSRNVGTCAGAGSCYSVSLSTGITPSGACTNYYQSSFFSPDSVLTDTSIIYVDTSCTTVMYVPGTYYSNGSSYYTTISNGQLTLQGSCSEFGGGA